MNASDIIADLKSAGIRVWEDKGKLRYRGPKAMLTSERLARIRDHRDAILETLRPISIIVEADQAARHEPFPLTDVQAAYLFGPQIAFGLGDVACHMYVELELDHLEVGRLEWAWNQLIERHDMLRAVVNVDGSQRVLPRVPWYHVAVSACADIAKTRDEMSHRLRDPGVWPLFELRVTTPAAPNQPTLHLSIDFIIADWTSIRILQNELEQLRRPEFAPLPTLNLTFRDYVHAQQRIRDTGPYERDRAYWLDRVDRLSNAPDLPLKHAVTSDGVPACFHRLTLRLSPERWSGLRSRAAARGISASGVVLAAYAEVLATWSRQPAFTLNLTLLNRLPLHSDVNSIVGDFTSVSLLAVDGGADATFATRASALAAQLFEDLDHRLFSGVEVMREIARRRGRAAALMPVVYTSAIGVDESTRGNAALSQPNLGWGITQTPQVWIDCQAMDWQGELLVNWDIRQGVLADGVADDMFAAFEQLLEQLEGDPATWDLSSPVGLSVDQAARRERLDANTGAQPERGLLHEPVLAMALRAPQRLAVLSSRMSLTYEALVARAAGVANALRASGFDGERCVAVEMDKGWEQVVAVLGILMAGGTWLPIDAHQPKARRRNLMDDAGVRHVLTQAQLETDPDPFSGRTVIAVDNILEADALALPLSMSHPEDTAYVMFTSGSTGKPKGVMVSHASAFNTIADVNRRFDVKATDRVLGLAHLGFDLSVYDIFGPLAVGGCLVLPDADRRSDPSHWVDLIQTHKVTLWNSVPAQLQMLEHCLSSATDAQLPSLRLALLSGDWIPVSLPPQIRARIPQLVLVSLGGATEAAIWSIYHRIEEVPAHWRSIPYGRPLAHQSVHVLGSHWQELPDLVTGEIYIGGVGLAKGYLGDTVKTSERFISHPYTGSRLYRTGDLGRYLRDGSIEFLGREDDQIKIRGHRIELGEVEAALLSCSVIKDAVVLAQGSDLLQRRLVAFAVPTAGMPDDNDAADHTQKTLATNLAQLLPDYMIPATIELVEALPLTGNGKVDRLHLQSLADKTSNTTSGEMPRTDLERRLAQIWMEVLNVPQIARDDDFFRMGGDSLSAAKLVGRIRESIPEAAGLFFDSLIRQLLPQPTIAALAAHLETLRPASSNRLAPCRPASPMQVLGQGNSTPENGRTYALVHDGSGTLAAYRPLVVYLAAHEPSAHIIGFSVSESQSYLHASSAVLVERRASSYARLLQTHGCQTVHVIGRGFGSLLALNLASQLMERTVALQGLTLVDPWLAPVDPDEKDLAQLFVREREGVLPWLEVDGVQDDNMALKVFEQSVRASAAHSASPYLGDITLLRAPSRALLDDAWQDLCLGEVRPVDLEPSMAMAEIASQAFVTDASPEALP